MTVREALTRGKNALIDHETETPDLDVALLLSDILKLSRAKLYMNLSEALSAGSLVIFDEALKRRVNGEPVAWITGSKEFWGLDFSVGPGVLCPRPDSEVLIEQTLLLMEELTSTASADSAERVPSGSLHDCCTGPGTLALALKSDRPDWKITASDIAEDAGRYFAENNQRLCGGQVGFKKADLMSGVEGPFDIIVSNPPYLTPRETEERRLLGWKEPVLALDGGGDDGLDLIRQLIPQVYGTLNNNGAVLIEADPLQMPIMNQILIDTGFNRIRVQQDLGNRDRVIIARKGLIE